MAEPLILSTRPKLASPIIQETAKHEEKLLFRLKILEEKLSDKTDALTKIAEFLHAIETETSEVQQLELEVLRLLKKKLEQT